MLGDVICIEAGALAGGDHLQPLGVIARERPVVLVQMIEDAELHWATVKGSAESPAGSAGKRAPRAPCDCARAHRDRDPRPLLPSARLAPRSPRRARGCAGPACAGSRAPSPSGRPAAR